MKKRISALILCICFAAAASGCGNTEDTDNRERNVQEENTEDTDNRERNVQEESTGAGIPFFWAIPIGLRTIN